MKPQVTIHNRQRVRAVNKNYLRRIALALLTERPQIEQADLGIYLVAEMEMTRLNEMFLRHQGSTDVVTFDYSDFRRQLHGEIFICVNEAVVQARTFQTSWQSEIVRYLVHGVLHLLGHGDLRGDARRKMKREEDRLLRRLSRRFSLAQLARRTRLGA
jgi:probable rRNA maturation factor